MKFFHSKFLRVLILLAVVSVTGVPRARAVSIMIGDNDGFGFGALAVPDGGALPSPLFLPSDNRSATEASSTNGAQQTDVYSAAFAAIPLPTSFDVIFPLAGDLLSGTLTVDMGGFQAVSNGPFDVAFNGVAQPGLFNFEDGTGVTAVRQFTLGSLAIDNANAANQFVVTISRGSSDDGVIFDYFRLDGTEVSQGPDVEPIPEPGTLLLLGTGFLALGGWRSLRRRLAG